MKNTFLFLLLIPFCARAQLMPNLIIGYSDPNDQNKPFDPTYVPARNYRVDNYSFVDSLGGLRHDEHYIIELDDQFVLRKQTKFPDSIPLIDLYTQSITSYSYTNSKLTSISRSINITNDSVLPSGSDSILYNSGLISILQRWGNPKPPHRAPQLSGLSYTYDHLNRFTGIKPYNYQEKVTHSGFYYIDSFTTSNKPVRLWAVSYRPPIDTPVKKNNVRTYYYDSHNRMICRTMFLLGIGAIYDSIVYQYSGTKQYPHTILNYETGKGLTQKWIYEYSSAGTISQILTYKVSGNDLFLTNKQVYTPLPQSALSEDALPLDFVILPNPTQGTFSIILPDNVIEHSISVVNILGEEVCSQQIQFSNRVEMSTMLKPGIYSVNIQNTSGRVSKKLVIH